jgi:hypothetical protein
METVIENEEWVNKTEAAEILGVSVRQVEIRAAKGEVRKRILPKKPNERAARVIYLREDLDAIRAGKPNRYGEPKPETALAVTPVSGGDPFAGLAAHLAALSRAFPPPVEKRPWLTLAEASEWSGLPAAWLTARAREGAPYAVNVGQGSKAHWRFNRAALAQAR